MSYTSGSIPADHFVNIIPGVISAGPLGVTLSTIALTTNPRVPIGTILNLNGTTSVADFFGPTSAEASEGDVYFGGYNLATQQPSNMGFVQYPTASVGAWLRGGDIGSMTLAQLQVVPAGVMSVVMNGTTETSGSINLASATSFTSASEIITTAFGIVGPTQATATGSFGATGTVTSTTTLIPFTGVVGTIHPGSTLTAAISGSLVTAGSYLISQSSGTIGGNGTYVCNNALTLTSTTVTVASNILDVGTIATGTIAVGQEVTGAGVATNTFVSVEGPPVSPAIYPTGTGGTGSYTTTSAAQTIASEALTMVQPFCTYDSLSGGFYFVSTTVGAASTMSYASGTIATTLDLTQATGATISQGATAATPVAFMDAVVAQNPNAATIFTLFDPDAGSGNAQKQLFAQWANSTGDGWAYMAWDNDITPTESEAATTSLGYILNQSESSGTVPIYEPTGQSLHLAAFAAGYAASINFSAPNGRADAAYKSQPGLIPSVTSGQVATNLEANGYNYYGAVATRGGNWNWFYPGSITGPYKWLDSYLNQIWLNNQLQIALINYLTSVGSVPFDPAGYAAIRQVLTAGANPPIIAPPQSPVAAALYNGIIDAGVSLSASQIQTVNNLVGPVLASQGVTNTLQQVGWYLFLQPATAAQRAARTLPTVILFYCDGGSVHTIDLSSLLVQ